jgi:CRISPR system Cascade subunit CasE
MIFLSRIIINSVVPQRQKILNDFYELHRSIMSAFPDEKGDARQKFNVLFSIRIKENIAEIIAQSGIKPDWEKSSICPRYANETWGCKEIGGIVEEAVKKRKIFSFQLVASPTKKISSEGKNSKRVLLNKEEDQIDWLIRKGQQNGFEVSLPSIILRPSEVKSGRKKEVFFRSVEFSGNLAVTEPKQFLEALVKGIGSEKAFGCGLLMLSR